MIKILKMSARQTDNLIYLAFDHDFNDITRVASFYKAAIEALGEAMAGTDKPLVIASSTMSCQKGILVIIAQPLSTYAVLASRSGTFPFEQSF